MKIFERSFCLGWLPSITLPHIKGRENCQGNDANPRRLLLHDRQVYLMGLPQVFCHGPWTYEEYSSIGECSSSSRSSCSFRLLGLELERVYYKNSQKIGCLPQELDISSFAHHLDESLAMEQSIRGCSCNVCVVARIVLRSTAKALLICP